MSDSFSLFGFPSYSMSWEWNRRESLLDSTLSPSLPVSLPLDWVGQWEIPT